MVNLSSPKILTGQKYLNIRVDDDDNDMSVYATSNSCILIFYSK